MKGKEEAEPELVLSDAKKEHDQLDDLLNADGELY